MRKVIDVGESDMSETPPEKRHGPGWQSDTGRLYHCFEDAYTATGSLKNRWNIPGNCSDRGNIRLLILAVFIIYNAAKPLPYLVSP